jgi:hypothetical protein
MSERKPLNFAQRLSRTRPAESGAPSEIKAPLQIAPPSETEATKGFLKLTNHFVYDLMPTLKPTDGYVLLYLIARTHGFGKTSIVITQGTIANACHISDSQVRVCMKTLATRKLIQYRIDRDNPNALLRGYWVEMLIPPPPARSDFKGASVSEAPSKSTPIKERTYERKNLKRDVSKEADASQCPDCHGTGMWYPEGFGKGVAKCRHERLKKSEG